MKECILILGACGQIGTELTQKLRSTYGNEAVIASDIRQPDSGILEQPLLKSWMRPIKKLF